MCTIMYPLTVVSAVSEGDSSETEKLVGKDYSALFIALVSLVIYVLFLRPTTNNNNSDANTEQGQPQEQQNAAQALAGRAPNTIATATNRPGPRRVGNYNQIPTRNALGTATNQLRQRPVHVTPILSENATEILQKCQTKPPHVKGSISATRDLKIGGSNILVDGLVAFSSTNASSLSSPMEEDSTMKKEIVRERAKILSQLLRTTMLKAPPSKGATIVLGIQQKRLDGKDGSVFTKVLSNLSTNYTVIVIVKVENEKNGKISNHSSTKETHERLVRQMKRDNIISESKLPSHRILVASSMTARIALVRQLASVALVVDFEAEIKTQLERFGYHVALQLDDWSASFPWLLTPSCC